MGILIHDAVLVTVDVSAEEFKKAIEEFRASMEPEFQPLLIGPALTPVNGDVGYVLYTFMPDGSKEYWDISDQGDIYREAFKHIIKRFERDGDIIIQWIHVRYGLDLEAGEIVEHAEDDEDSDPEDFIEGDVVPVPLAIEGGEPHVEV